MSTRVESVVYEDGGNLAIYDNLGERVIVRFLDGQEKRGVITGVKCVGGWTNWDGVTQTSVTGDMHSDPVFSFDLGPGSKHTIMAIAVKLDAG